jgi:hypothetical protein
VRIFIPISITDSTSMTAIEVVERLAIVAVP